MPGTRVLDRDPHGPVRLPELERDPPAVGRRPERVREQVVDDLEHAVAVGDDHGPFPHGDLEVDRAGACLLGEGLVGPFDQVLHPDLLAEDA